MEIAPVIYSSKLIYNYIYNFIPGLGMKFLYHMADELYSFTYFVLTEFYLSIEKEKYRRFQ